MESWTGLSPLSLNCVSAGWIPDPGCWSGKSRGRGEWGMASRADGSLSFYQSLRVLAKFTSRRCNCACIVPLAQRRGEAEREPGWRDWAGRRWHVKEEEADLLSNLGIFLTSRCSENGQEQGKREEVDIPPEPRAHAKPSWTCVHSATIFHNQGHPAPSLPWAAGLRVPLMPAPGIFS